MLPLSAAMCRGSEPSLSPIGFLTGGVTTAARAKLALVLFGQHAGQHRRQAVRLGAVMPHQRGQPLEKRSVVNAKPAL